MYHLYVYAITNEGKSEQRNVSAPCEAMAEIEIKEYTRYSKTAKYKLAMTLPVHAKIKWTRT